MTPALATRSASPARPIRLRAILPNAIVPGAAVGCAAAAANGCLGLAVDALRGPAALPDALVPSGMLEWTWLAIEVAILSPLGESALFLAIVQALLRRLPRAEWIVALALAATHSLQAPRWSIQALPLFLSSAACLRLWRHEPWPSRYAGLVAIHFTHNLASLASLVALA